MGWFINRTVRTKVLAAIAVSGLVTVLVTWLGLSALSDANGTMRTVAQQNVRFEALAEARDGISDTLGAVDAAAQQAADAGADAGIAEYAEMNPGAPQIAAFRKALSDYRALRDNEMLPAANSGRIDIYFQLHTTRAMPLIQQAEQQLDELQAAESARSAEWVTAADAAYERSRTMILLAVVIGLVASVALGLWVAHLVVRPLRRVADVLGAVAKGDLNQRVEVRSADEVGVTARALNSATESMRATVRTMDGTAGALATSSAQLTDISTEIASGTEEASDQANLVAAAAEQVSRNVQTVAAGAEQMGMSIREIAQNASEAAKVASHAVSVAESTNQAVARLGDSSTEIGNVVKVITSIAEQTNLLALNATIEAARAGEAGKGFAVVANEVKDLAQETARATEDISRRVEAIQSDTTGAVAAIGQIGQIIARINDYQLTIASAVEEQTATTTEMNRSVAEAATGSVEIASNVSGVATATRSATEQAASAQRAATELTSMSGEMRNLVARFRI
jgi:methyl-accepting chemotaxis protein